MSRKLSEREANFLNELISFHRGAAPPSIVIISDNIAKAPLEKSRQIEPCHDSEFYAKSGR
jgi:hypothetical protein